MAVPGRQSIVTIGAVPGQWFDPSPSSTVSVTVEPPKGGYIAEEATGNGHITASGLATFVVETADELGSLTWTGHNIRSFEWAETSPDLADEAGTFDFIIGVALGIVSSVIVTGAGWLLKKYSGLETPH